MKSLFKYKITSFILICWALFSLVGYLRKDTIYKIYTADAKNTPYFVLVLMGIHDHIYPWSIEDISSVDVFAAEKSRQSAPDNGGGKPDDKIAAPQEIKDEVTPQESKTEAFVVTVQEADTDSSGEPVSVITEDEADGDRPFVEVDMSYFDDAVFIGDSRTVGLNYYGGIDNADFYATKGMNVYDLWNNAFCDVDGTNMTLEEALNLRQYKKIYFQIGINEMGTGTIETFMEAYRQTVEKLEELQPDAIIYVQGIMRVTKEKSDHDAIYNNEGIDARNNEIRKLADGKRIFYIDVNDVVSDESGALNAELTFDNLHLYASEYGIWVDYLKTKGINAE